MSSNFEPGTFPYIIQPEDSIWDLADQYYTTVEDIMAANPGVDPDNLYVGQVISLPGDPPSTWVEAQADPPERRPGFERRPEFERRPGFERRFPFRRPFFRPYCPSGRLYRVEPGDNPYIIARRFGIPIYLLFERNRFVDLYNLQPGQMLCIPFR